MVSFIEDAERFCEGPNLIMKKNYQQKTNSCNWK